MQSDCRFRTTNHYLPIETGRWRNIDRGNRYCNLCNCQKLGDEYHYVLECSSLNDKRKQLLPKYFMKRHNVVKFFEFLRGGSRGGGAPGARPPKIGKKYDFLA